MSIFQKKKEMIKLSFNFDESQVKKLKEIEDKALEKGLKFDMDLHMRKALSRILNSAEKELKTS